MNGQVRPFEDGLFFGVTNRFVGSGGEVLVKKDGSAPPTRMDVGDRLMGIGATHLVENLDVPPGPDAFWSPTTEPDFQLKSALRAIEVESKVQTDSGFDFEFIPLPPAEYASTLRDLSEGAVEISADQIPEGTIILS